MDINKFTQKTQEALQSAQTLALQANNTEVDTDHLLLALINQEDGVTGKLLKKLDLSSKILAEEVEKSIQTKPKVTGGGTDPSRIMVTKSLNQALIKAEE